MNAEHFREILIEIMFIDRDVIERAGICPDTAARMMSNPIKTFNTMTVGERKRFWPLVEASIERKREHEWREHCHAQFLSGELSRDGSWP